VASRLTNAKSVSALYGTSLLSKGLAMMLEEAVAPMV
jgi:hypothetical protein